MANIQVLDQITIDKIAAGEVIERPASIVKELVENSIDAGAASVTVEIREGGISFIRITDNGSGIEREDIRNAFLRHSTSKIRSVDDLVHIQSLGFRGEALSSIAAVSQVELITKTKADTFGTRYVIEGGQEQLLEDTGAPDGTTFLVRQLFYNVPARRKFLKTAMTEAGHVQDLLMRLALSHPEVSFQFLNQGQEKLCTSGNGSIKDVIYSIYGRNVAASLLPLDFEKNSVRIRGFLGEPSISRGNRNFENFFINGRYVKSGMISKAIEDAYKDFVMQHKFPFVVLHFTLDGEEIDVNVHPTKMELRFNKQQEVYGAVYEAVHSGLRKPELIPHIEAPDMPVIAEEPVIAKMQVIPEVSVVPEKNADAAPAEKESPFLLKPKAKPEVVVPEERDEEYFIQKMKARVESYHNRSSAAEVKGKSKLYKPDVQAERIREQVKQLELFEEKLLAPESQRSYQLIGQLFDTYWLVQFADSLYIIDQHAAHERVLYERTLKEMKNREFTSQYLSPPLILSLSLQEADTLKTHIGQFERIGFEIEPFGGEEYAVRAVPANLFSIAKQELLLEMLDGLADGITSAMTPELIDEKVASMSCKAAVKGNNRLSGPEVDTLLKELLALDNPYHCPHGRPTIIAMTKRELEKKFKRIL